MNTTPAEITQFVEFSFRLVNGKSGNCEHQFNVYAMSQEQAIRIASSKVRDDRLVPLAETISWRRSRHCEKMTSFVYIGARW